MLLFRCRKCGTQSADLEGHKCVAAATRLEAARAVLAQVEERKEVRPLPGGGDGVLATLGPPLLMQDRHLEAIKAAEKARAAKKAGFDRNVYHKAYMKTYMRGWRARKRRRAAEEEAK